MLLEQVDVKITEIEKDFDSLSINNLNTVLTEEINSMGKDTFKCLTLNFKRMTPNFLKKLESFYTENSSLFKKENPFNNCYLFFVIVNIEDKGIVSTLFNEHNNQFEGLYSKFLNYNSEASKFNSIVDKNKKDKVIKELSIPTVEKSVTNRGLMFLIQSSIDFSKYLFSSAEYSQRSNLDVDVDFQRDLVWSDNQKKRLILNILKGLPIGNFYINDFNIYSEHDKTGKPFSELSDICNVLYDGKQRLTTVRDFIMNKFPIEINDDEFYFENLPEELKYRITGLNVPVYTTNITDKNDLIDFYVELNTMQSPHTEEDIYKSLKFKK